MTSQQLTMVNQSASSTATCNVIEVGLQNKKQRAHYDHDGVINVRRMWLWFGYALDGNMLCLFYGALSRYIWHCNIMITFKRLVAHLKPIRLQQKLAKSTCFHNGTFWAYHFFGAHILKICAMRLAWKEIKKYALFMIFFIKPGNLYQLTPVYGSLCCFLVQWLLWMLGES